MTMLSGETSAEVPFPIARCWELVSDIERAPSWQRTLESVEVVERDAQGRPVLCDTVNDAKVTKVKVRVAVEYEPPVAMRFRQVQSEDLDAMEGGWRLDELRPDLTRATYFLSLDPGSIPFFARPLERAIRATVMGHQARELAEALRSAP
jgi:ribosome-associated toxin RatA of RatAB toxin-antitoxin module